MNDKKNILLVGGGGREAAIAWKLAQSPRVGRIFCAPGNAGMKAVAEVCGTAADDLDGICRLAEETKPDFVFVAPDDPLAAGLCDRIRAMGVPCFGPSAAAARIEASKEFAKKLMKKKNVPTADYEVFEDPEAALAYVREAKHPLVLKADGLALGKGVLICPDLEASEEAVKSMMIDDCFHGAGKKVLAEEFLEGEEMSLLVFTDGEHYQMMLPAKDYKRALDHNEGLNTGGMGSICPSRVFSEEEKALLKTRIIEPTLEGMRELGCPFEGVLYFGLMWTADGPKIIEYNARFGDPETQAVLPLLKTDLLDIMEAIYNRTLDQLELEWEDMACACVILASGGYPEAYRKGYEIRGLEQYPQSRDDQKTYENRPMQTVFTAGTAEKDGKIVTSGGRVLALVSRDRTLPEALAGCYRMTETVDFENRHFRSDIGS